MNDILFNIPKRNNKNEKSHEKLQIDFYEQKLNFEIDPADLHEALKNNKNVIVIDARSAQSFTQEHIPGAINIPHRTMNTETTRHLDKTALVVTYCDGIGCNASTKGALNMVKLGFTVKELIGGIAWWKADGFTTEGNAEPVQSKIGCDC
ncbi:MAG: rhodanese-like domain-containing protein [Cyclobacteriaceae bacterium]|nr:rhodanese-like domain-containing protein [Cyclobacteriaceae bacterium]